MFPRSNDDTHVFWAGNETDDLDMSPSEQKADLGTNAESELLAGVSLVQIALLSLQGLRETLVLSASGTYQKYEE